MRRERHQRKFIMNSTETRTLSLRDSERGEIQKDSESEALVHWQGEPG